MSHSSFRQAQSKLPFDFAGLVQKTIHVEEPHIARLLTCACGCEAGIVSASKVPDSDEMRDPLFFDCPACGKEIGFFDSERHGYDGRLNGGAGYVQGGTKTATICNGCGEKPAVLSCTLSYNIDFEDEDESELAKQAQDYFDAIDVAAKCASCGSERSVGQWEMA